MRIYKRLIKRNFILIIKYDSSENVEYNSQYLILNVIVRLHF